VSWKTIRKENIDLIHSHWIIPQGLVGALLQLVSGIPHITSIHGTDIHLVHSHRFIFPCLRFIAKYSDFITTNSNHTYRLVHDIVPFSEKKILTIPMGIHPEEYGGQGFRSPSNVKTILFVGRLIPWKGVRVLIEAMKKVCNHPFWFHLIIIGDGPERGDLEELSRRLEIEHSVEFTGRFGRDTLLAYYHRADLFVLPSTTVDGQTEGLGVVLLEAMASGLPVIGSNTGGIPDIIQDRVNGLLVSPGDPDVLADAILSILSDPDLAEQFKKAGFRTVNERFSWDCIVDQFIQVYKKALFKSDSTRRR
jgi:glycosyltransferase involved in cell wall biosynthesis